MEEWEGDVGDLEDAVRGNGVHYGHSENPAAPELRHYGAQARAAIAAHLSPIARTGCLSRSQVGRKMATPQHWGQGVDCLYG